MMKKVLLIACVAMMVMGLASMASASYIWNLNACSTTGTNYGTAITVGVMPDANAGIADQAWASSGNAYVAQVVFAADGTTKSQLLKKDYVKASDEATKLGKWYVQVWAPTGYQQSTFDFRMWVTNIAGGAVAQPLQVKMAYDPFGTIAAGTVLSPANGVATTSGGSLTSPTLKYNLAAYKTDTPFAANNGYILEISPYSSVPEPGSMLAMLSGLVGLVGYGIRRRK